MDGWIDGLYTLFTPMGNVLWSDESKRLDKNGRRISEDVDCIDCIDFIDCIDGVV